MLFVPRGSTAARRRLRVTVLDQLPQHAGAAGRFVGRMLQRFISWRIVSCPRALRVSLLLSRSESSVNIGHSLRDSSWRGTGIGTTVKSGLQIQLCILFSSRTSLAVQVCCFSVPQCWEFRNYSFVAAGNMHI